MALLSLGGMTASASVLLLILVGWTPTSWAAAAEGMGWVWLVIAVVAAALALMIGRSVLRRWAVVLVALWLALGGSLWLSALGARGHGDGIRLVSSNVMVNNSTPQSAARAIASQDAGISVVVEATSATDQALASVWGDAVHLVARGTGLNGRMCEIWSRWPARWTGAIELDRWSLPVATLDTPQGPLTVVGVHTLPPLNPESLEVWWAQFRQLTNWVKEWEQADRGPLVLAGDFNASVLHPPMRELLEYASDASVARGHLFSPTWPAKRTKASPFSWPVLDLDHVLLHDAGVSSAWDFRVEGSDHLGVGAEITLR